MKTNNKTDNSKLFWGVFLLLFIFGMIFLSTLFLFGKSEYLTLGVVAQLMSPFLSALSGNFGKRNLQVKAVAGTSIPGKWSFLRKRIVLTILSNFKTNIPCILRNNLIVSK